MGKCRTCGQSTKNIRNGMCGDCYSKTAQVTMYEPEPKRFRWVIEVVVDSVWIEDGFNFDEDRCRWLSENLIDYAYPHEVKVRMLEAPDPKQIRKTQGYED